MKLYDKTINELVAIITGYKEAEKERKDYNKTYRESDKGKAIISKAMKKYYVKNRGKILEKQRLIYQKAKDELQCEGV
tara:strand:+ start:162 stop:395 length:234 start_codon:yes stop_codon:yes gene_type:complete